jgi:hypothetical protein
MLSDDFIFLRHLALHIKSFIYKNIYLKYIAVRQHT